MLVRECFLGYCPPLWFMKVFFAVQTRALFHINLEQLFSTCIAILIHYLWDLSCRLRCLGLHSLICIGLRDVLISSTLLWFYSSKHRQLYTLSAKKGVGAIINDSNCLFSLWNFQLYKVTFAFSVLPGLTSNIKYETPFLLFIYLFLVYSCHSFIFKLSKYCLIRWVSLIHGRMSDFTLLVIWKSL